MAVSTLSSTTSTRELWRATRGSVRLWPSPSGGRLLQGGQPDGELAPLAGAFARGGDAPAVHLDELLDERQADPEPALGAGHRAVPLGEEVEDAGQELGRDADARVPDPDDDLGSPRAGP